MLEIKVVYHGPDGSRQIARMHIIQSKKHEGSVRTYAVSCRSDMHTERPVTQMGSVVRHDRNQPVWELIKKAIEGLDEP